MDGRAEPVQRAEMLRHAVAHVALEAVAGMRRAEPHHQPVARDLGDDRGGGNRQHQRVAGDDRLAVAAGVDPVAAVDEHQLGPHRQRPHRARQRPERGLQDIVAVDARGRAEGNRDLGGGANPPVELLALRRRQLLGIVEPARDALGVEHDGGGDHRAGQRPAPRLVAAGNRPQPAVERGAFAPECRAHVAVVKRQAGIRFVCGATHRPRSCAPGAQVNRRPAAAENGGEKSFANPAGSAGRRR